jgi:hypothetical protein
MKGRKPDHGRGTGLAKSDDFNGFKIKGRMWIEKCGQTFLSWGRVLLLELIASCSICLISSSRTRRFSGKQFHTHLSQDFPSS